MKTFHAAGIALALAVSASHVAVAQTDRIIGGFTTVAFSSSFLDYTRESGIFITDLGGNALQNGIEILPPSQGVIDLQTGVTDVIFKAGFQVGYIGRTTVRVRKSSSSTRTRTWRFRWCRRTVCSRFPRSAWASRPSSSPS